MPTIEETMAANAKANYMAETGLEDIAPEVEPKPDADPAPEAEPKPDAYPAPEAEPKPDADPAPEAEPKPDADPAPDVDPAPAPEAEPKPDAELKPVATFEEQLAEKFGGKSFEDIEAALNPKSPFANDKMARFNELAEKGIDVTSKEFLEVQSLDVDALKKNDDVLFEKWKRGDEGKGLSEATIRHEINEKYKVDDWIEKDPSEFTASDRANKEKMNRDANLGKEWLTNFKEERTLVKEVDPAIAEEQAKKAEAFQSGWEKQVDTDLVNKVTKLTSPISYKGEDGKTVDSEFSFDVSEQDRKEVGEIMKQLTKPNGTGAFFDQFKDAKGEPNHEALFTLMLKGRNFDKVVSLASSDSAEKRAIAIERAQKNSSMKPNETSVKDEEFATAEDAKRAAFRKSNGTN